jgi:hypothetical protein
MRLKSHNQSILGGLICGVVGFVSVVTSIALVIAKFVASKPIAPAVDLLLNVMTFFFCQVFLAFGAAAMLFGLQGVIGARPWITKTRHFAWKRSMRFVMLMGVVSMACGAIGAIVNLISRWP